MISNREKRFVYGEWLKSLSSYFSGHEHNLSCSLGSLKGKPLIRSFFIQPCGMFSPAECIVLKGNDNGGTSGGGSRGEIS